jgi:hypothetical protein
VTRGSSIFNVVYRHPYVPSGPAVPEINHPNPWTLAPTPDDVTDDPLVDALVSGDAYRRLARAAIAAHGELLLARAAMPHATSNFASGIVGLSTTVEACAKV